MQKKLFKIGQIINTHGIKGEVKVYPLTEDVQKFKRLKSVLVGGVDMNIQGVKFQKDRVILKLEGVDTMNDAETYKQKYIEIPRDKEPKLPPDTYYVADSRSPRDGKFIDEIGYYNPLTEPVEFKVDEEKANKWLANGAQPTNVVKRLFDNAGLTK